MQHVPTVPTFKQNLNQFENLNQNDKMDKIVLNQEMKNNI